MYVNVNAAQCVDLCSFALFLHHPPHPCPLLFPTIFVKDDASVKFICCALNEFSGMKWNGVLAWNICGRMNYLLRGRWRGEQCSQNL
jgi:hypothetical protein